MAIILVLEARVKPNQRAALESFIREARPYYESIGDVAMRFMWHADDEDRFRETFEYATEEAYQLDDARVRNEPEMKAWLNRWRQLLEGKVSVSVWREWSIQKLD